MRNATEQVLLIEPSRFDAFVERCTANAALPKDKLEYFMGARPQPEKVGAVAVLPISGTILSGTTAFERDMGATDVAEISAWLDAAAADESVKGVMFNVDSPGGTVSGVPELADKIAAFPKPTAAFTSGMAASAAYWLSSQAGQVFTTPSASVGSIGVYVAVKDTTLAYEQQGIRVEVIKAGDLKAAGHPGTSLTDAQRADIQDRVNGIHADFKSAVKGKRPFASESDMRGQVMLGKHAAQRGLATGLATSLSDALTRFSANLK